LKTHHLDNLAASSTARSLLSFINHERWCYCIVGDTRGIPDRVDGDIDIILSLDNLAVSVESISRFCRQYDLQLIQVIQHEDTAFYFVIAGIGAKDNLHYLNPDICGDYYRNGRFLLSAQELLDNRLDAFNENGESRGFYVTSPAREFIYYLLKKVDKKELDDRHGDHLSEEWNKDQTGCLVQIERFWRGEDAVLLTLAAQTNDWEAVRCQLSRMQIDLRKKMPFSLGSWIRELRRKIRRILHPTGLAVVLLGPDGIGKSSVIARLEVDFEPAFRRTKRFHLRPHFGKSPNGGTPVTDPHRQPARGMFSSIAKLCLWWFDYLFGYIVAVYPHLVRSTLVLFDRYYHDLLVDAKRYRYGGPGWLGALVGNAPEIVRSRKRELSLAEAVRQREAYLELAGRLPLNRVNVVDASLHLDEVAATVNGIILDHLARRVEKRYHLGQG
jgi:thymidylate kinase